MKTSFPEPLIEEITWKDIRNKFMPICSELTEIIDAIDPSEDMGFIKIRYPFGSRIVHSGVVNLPADGGNMYPITDMRLPVSIRNKLNYSHVPLGFIVKGGIEVIGEVDNRVFSVAAWRQGLDIGIWEYFDWKTPYGVTAGAKSLFLLPKVTLSQSHKRLKRDYNVTSPPPKLLFDNWNLFKQIANSHNFSEQWTCEVIYFTGKWIEKLNSKDFNWNKLHNYILNKGWSHSDYARKKSIFDILWQVFARSLHLKGLKPNSYVLDTLKHLAFIGIGVLPASQPSFQSRYSIKHAEIIYGTTGTCSIKGEDYKLIKDGCLLVSCSSRDVEFDMAYLQKNYQKKTVFEGLDEYTNEKQVFYIAANGRPVNFIDGAVIGPILALVQAEIILAIQQLLEIQGEKGIFETSTSNKKLLAEKWLGCFCDGKSGRYRVDAHLPKKPQNKIKLVES